MTETPREQAVRHVPVLLDRCLELLAPAVAGPGAVLVDMTLGLGGHAEARSAVPMIPYADDDVAVLLREQRRDGGYAILDYKTYRPAPANLAGVPVEHVAQLAIYAELVQAIYPGRKVRTLLLYTHAPRLIELPPERWAAALASLARA